MTDRISAAKMKLWKWSYIDVWAVSATWKKPSLVFANPLSQNV